MAKSLPGCLRASGLALSVNPFLVFASFQANKKIILNLWYFHLRTHAGSLEVSRKRPCCRTVRTQYKRVGAPRRAPQQTSGGCSGPAAATAARTQLRLQLQTFGEAVAFCVARIAAAAATLLSPPPACCRAPDCAVVPVGAVPGQLPQAHATTHPDRWPILIVLGGYWPSNSSCVTKAARGGGQPGGHLIVALFVSVAPRCNTPTGGGHWQTFHIPMPTLVAGLATALV